MSNMTHMIKYQNIILSVFEDCCALHGFPVCSYCSLTNKNFLTANIAVYLTAGVLMAFGMVSLYERQNIV